MQPEPDRGRGFVLYPAIDLKAGHAVRLTRGAMESATTYATDPAAQARAFARAGATRLHVVDLDGAFAGASRNAAAIRAVLAVGLPTQLGGGIRSMEAIDHWLAAGAARVILGSAALKNPALVAEAARRHPGRIAVGIDARDGMVATEGWAEASTIPALDLARRMAEHPLAAIIFTDIDQDGTLAGPNTAATRAIAEAVAIPVIASGGIGTLAHLQALTATGIIAGAILGRALYEGRFTLQEALRVSEGEHERSAGTP